MGNEFYTGDIGFMDEDGWFYLVDRKKDMIIRSPGFASVRPREIRGRNLRASCCSGGRRDWGGGSLQRRDCQGICGPEAGRATRTGSLIEFCRKRLAAYKYPREVEIVVELPKSLSGKILRQASFVPIEGEELTTSLSSRKESSEPPVLLTGEPVGPCAIGAPWGCP